MFLLQGVQLKGLSIDLGKETFPLHHEGVELLFQGGIVGTLS